MMAYGTKYRPAIILGTVTEEVRTEVEEELQAAAARMITAWADEEGEDLDAYLAAVSHGITAVVHAHLPIGSTIHVPSRDPQLFENLPSFTAEDHDALRRFHRHFVVTYADKADNNMVIVCKKHYVSQIMADLESANPPPLPVYVRSLETAEQIVAQHTHAMAGFGLHCAAPTLPVYYSIAKLHKQPIGARFIAGSREVTTTALNKLLTSFFRGMQPAVQQLWSSTVGQIPGFAETTWPWLLTDSASMIPRLFALNRKHYLEQVQQTTADFKRLYTNLPIADLQSTLLGLVQEVATVHGNAVAVKIWADPRKPLDWLSADKVPLQQEGRSGGTRWKVHSLHDLMAGLHWLLENTYIVFGGRVYRQQAGIPMGGNAAVYIANYFLLVSELRFMRRLLQAIQQHPHGAQELQYTSQAQLLQPQEPLHPGRAALFIARCFQFSSRFVDDLHTVNNPMLPHLTYTSQTLAGVQGIYPPALELEVTAEGSTVPFLDLHISPAHRNQCCPLTTRLYDKRRRPDFQAVQLVRFPHITSNLSVRCKYNIVIGQFHRFRRIILDRDNFAEECAALLLAMQERGYKLATMRRKLGRQLRLWPGIYDASPSQLAAAVDAELSRQQQ